eukprot:c12016_g1_i1.p1 GENE.c12016_g1_i1~~c12016_g1_i1.p1  ORF type:complete len:748 (-),score=190.97 c12016_g1_i1:210-2453(-)
MQEPGPRLGATQVVTCFMAGFVLQALIGGGWPRPLTPQPHIPNPRSHQTHSTHTAHNTNNLRDAKEEVEFQFRERMVELALAGRSLDATLQPLSSHRAAQKQISDDSICTGTGQQGSESQYMCYGGQLLAILSLFDSTVMTAEDLEGPWQSLYVLVLFQPLSFSRMSPAIGNLTQLQALYMTASLEGSIPLQLFSLGGLQLLHIDSTRNASGQLPSTFSQLPNLKNLVLSGTNLTGSIPADLNHVSSLVTFDVSDNKLSGVLPLFNISSLAKFAVHQNRISGTIPPQFGSLSALTWLSLDNNMLSGTIPTQIGRCASLNHMGLSWNLLNGTIPTQLGTLTNLVLLELAGNQLSGTIPSQLAQLAYLRTLDVSLNKLTGTIPVELRADVTVRCDFSGIQDLRCARVCHPCQISEFQIQECNSRGLNQKCVSGYYLLPGVVVYVCVVGLGLARLAPAHTRHTTLAAEALTSALGMAHIAAALAFALTCSHAALRVSSLCVLACLVAASLVCAVVVISRVATMPIPLQRLRDTHATTAPDTGGPGAGNASIADPGLIHLSDSSGMAHDVTLNKTDSMASSTPQYLNQQFRSHVYNNTVLLAYAVTFCALNVRVLPFITGNLGVRELMGTGGVYCAQHDEDDGPNANTDTNVNANTKQKQRKKRVMKLRGAVGVMVVVLMDVPQLIIQVIGAVSGETGKFLALALVASVASLLVEIPYVCLRSGLFCQDRDQTTARNKPSQSTGVHAARDV